MSDINGMTPDEIKADIERKRNEMSEKIDTIQDRFRPDNLKAEAKSVAQDVIKESSDVLKDYLRTNAQEMTRAVGESFRRNPIPTALMALGLGWLVYSSVNGRSDEQESMRGYPRASRYDGGYDGYGARGIPPRPYSRQEYGRGAFGYERGYANQGYSGQGYTDRDRYGYEQPGYREGDSSYAEWYERAEEIRRRIEREERGSVMHRAVEKVKDVAQTVGATVGEQASRVGEPVADAGATLRDKAESLGERVGDTVGNLTDRMGDMGEQMGDRMSDLGGAVRERAGEYSQQFRARAEDLGYDTRFQVMRAQDTLTRTLEDNPLTFGAVALLAGAAVGLALPSTRHERMLMGETPDRLVERTQQVASNVVGNVVEEVKQVAGEVAPRLQETVTQVVDDLTQTGQQVGAEVAQGVRQATDAVARNVSEAADTLTPQSEG